MSAWKFLIMFKAGACVFRIIVRGSVDFLKFFCRYGFPFASFCEVDSVNIAVVSRLTNADNKTSPVVNDVIAAAFKQGDNDVIF